ncbi:MAG: N-formylglutamate amidohydrolase [bacterium]
MKKLPVLISIPHGGLAIPPELDERVVLDEHEIFGEADAHTREIYTLSGLVQKVCDFDIARVFIDLNRPPDSLPPEKEDGVIKDITTYGVKIYRGGSEPDPDISAALLDQYYWPYHRKIVKAQEEDSIELGLDCHSMAAVAPPTAHDAGSERPLICLGDVHGESSPSETTESFRECLAEALAMDKEEIALNKPFAGGHITRTYGSGDVPWIQIEISRALYLKPGAHPSSINPEDNGIKKLNQAMEKALRLFFE